MTYELRRRIELHLKRTGTAPTRFGRDVCRDQHLLKDMRNGRVPGPGITTKIIAYLEANGQ